MISPDLARYVRAVVVLAAATGSLTSQIVNPANGHIYQLSPPLPYGQARAYANSLSGYLVAINDSAEQSFVVAHFGGQERWIGLTDELQEGTFVWDSGEPLTYTAWCPGEPNNSGNEDCGTLTPNNCWNDLGAGTVLTGIVEIGLGNLSAPTLAAIGSPLVYSILTLSSTPYVFDISLAGTTPGLILQPGSVHIPLNPPYLHLSYGPAFPTYFTNFVGFTNAGGIATPIVTIPNEPQIVGTVINACSVTLDPLSPSGIGLVSNATTTTIANHVPVIIGVSPPTSPTTGSWPITIHGGYFQQGATVQIGGSSVPAAVVTSSMITCNAPAHALGPVSIVVTNPDGFTATLMNGLTYVAPLLVSQIAPLTAASGGNVTITGSGIQPGATVLVGGTSGSVVSATPTSLTFTMPAAVPCDTTAIITNPDGQNASIPFNPSPTISFTFNGGGPASGGTPFIVLGSSFLPGTTVTVGGAAASITSQSSTTLFVVSPSGTPGLATVVVASVGGCSATTTFLYQ